MMSTRSLKHRLSRVFRDWHAKRYDAALGQVEELLRLWPGNAKLQILWASQNVT